MACDAVDATGRQLLAEGLWNANTTLSLRGGQGMHFRVTNTNVVGTQLTITSNGGGGADTGILVPPLTTRDYPDFSTASVEPISWTFDVSTVSDVFAVTWCLYSTWVPAVPAVQGVEPASGIAGAQVVITGIGLGGATSVHFGATDAPITGWDLATGRISVTAPAETGTVDVTVSTDAGTSPVTAADQFTYIPVPTVTEVSPSQGLAGDTVTVTGSGFANATDVSFGPQSVAPTTGTDTELTVIAPNGAGTVDVTVTGPGGASPATAADQFTYTPVPTVTGVSPSQGATGDTVTVTGSGFTGLTDVTFGAASVQSSIDSDTQFTVTAPEETGTVDITVTTPAGTSAVTDADQFTYAA